MQLRVRVACAALLSAAMAIGKCGKASIAPAFRKDVTSGPGGQARARQAKAHPRIARRRKRLTVGSMAIGRSTRSYKIFSSQTNKRVDNANYQHINNY